MEKARIYDISRLNVHRYSPYLWSENGGGKKIFVLAKLWRSDFKLECGRIGRLSLFLQPKYTVFRLSFSTKGVTKILTFILFNFYNTKAVLAFWKV